MARACGRGVLAALPLLAAGCFGVSSNPFRLGNLPAGDIVRTHAKPAGRGYYRNSDPHAAALKVEHVGPDVNQVRSQHVLVATVCDKEGVGRRARRVEWHVSGVGHLVEVDESGVFPGRGYMVDDRYAVTYTNFASHKIDRGNDDPSDDFTIEPGQTWAVITSDVEGETHVTVHATGIANWDEHKKFVIKHWIDADAVFPPDAVNPVGTVHDLVTQVRRHSDKTAANNYLVTYQIVDGPPAILEAPGVPPGPVVTVPIDGQGRAVAKLRQTSPTIGANRIRMDVSRPPNGPNGRQVNVAAQTMTKTWVAPVLKLEKFGPDLVKAGDLVEYRVQVSNLGTVATSAIVLRDTLPPTLQLVGTAPIVAPSPDGTLQWTIPALQPGEMRGVQIMARATAPGMVTNVAEAVAENAPLQRGVVMTRVVAPKLEIAKTGPTQAAVGERVDFRVKVKNVGDGPALHVTVEDVFDPGLVPLDGRPIAFQEIPSLEPGQENTVDVSFICRATGDLCNVVFAKAENFPQGVQSRACVKVLAPIVSVVKRFVGQQAERIFVEGVVKFEIEVANDGKIDAKEVVLRDQLPAELEFQRFDEGEGTAPGRVLPGGVAVEWPLGTLKPGDRRVVRFRAVAKQASTQRVCNRALVTMNGGFTMQSEPACLFVDGVPAYNLEILPDRNPVRTGERVLFRIKALNPGSETVLVASVELLLGPYLKFEAGANDRGAVAKAPGDGPVIFNAQLELPPKGEAIYEVRALARRPARAVVTAKAVFESMAPAGSPRGKPATVTQQQSLTIYDPDNSGSMDGNGAVGTGAEFRNLAGAPAPLPPRRGMTLRLGPTPVAGAPNAADSGVLMPAVAGSGFGDPSPPAPASKPRLKLNLPPAPPPP